MYFQLRSFLSDYLAFARNFLRVGSKANDYGNILELMDQKFQNIDHPNWRKICT